MKSCMFSFGCQLIFIKLIANTSPAQAASWTFTKPCPIENFESDKLRKTFIFMSTVVILYLLRFFVADPMQICLALRRGKTCVHHTYQQLSN